MTHEGTPRGAEMDTHHGDTLSFRARRFLLVERPLEPYLDLSGRRSRPASGAQAAAGAYAANWEIEDGWLYLAGLAGQWSDSSPATLRELFPFAGARVFATWFSGTVHGFRHDDAQPCAAAGRRRYPDLVLTIDAGRVRGSSIVHRGAATMSDAARATAGRIAPRAQGSAADAASLRF